MKMSTERGKSNISDHKIKWALIQKINKNERDKNRITLRPVIKQEKLCPNMKFNSNMSQKQLEGICNSFPTVNFICQTQPLLRNNEMNVTKSHHVIPGADDYKQWLDKVSDNVKFN